MANNKNKPNANQNTPNPSVAEFDDDDDLELMTTLDHYDATHLDNMDPNYVYRHVAERNVDRLLRSRHLRYEKSPDHPISPLGSEFTVMRCRRKRYERRQEIREQRLSNSAKPWDASTLNDQVGISESDGGFVERPGHNVKEMRRNG